MSGLTHLDEQGRATMVDVGAKETTRRMAIARGEIRMQPATLAAIRAGNVPKGDVLASARIAGILGAKRTPDLIPLCHPLQLTKVSVDFEVDEAASRVLITATVHCNGPTGVEMEALTAVSVAALTIYDMAKALEKEMVIGAIRLEEKRGGKSGDYVRAAPTVAPTAAPTAAPTVEPASPQRRRRRDRSMQGVPLEERSVLAQRTQKYDPLWRYLETLDRDLGELTLTFDQVDKVLGFPLPASARTYREWWANPTRAHTNTHAQSWLRAGWKVDSANMTEGWVRFRRRHRGEPPHRKGTEERSERKPRGLANSKYDPLRRHLLSIEPDTGDVTFPFSALEQLLGFPLPASARKYQAWWANSPRPEQHPHAQSWLRAGWRVDGVNLKAEQVRFRRTR